MASMGECKLSRRDFVRLAGMAGGSALGLGLLAGCRRSRPAPTPSPTAKAGPTPVPGAAELARGGTVKWAEFYSTLSPEDERALGIDAKANQAWMAGVARQFEHANPGWQVQLEAIPFDTMDQRLVTDANANVSHDLVFCTPQLMARHKQLGDLLDLTPFLARLTAGERDDLSWSPVWQAAKPGGDQQLAVPAGLRAHALAYNRSRYLEAGLDPKRPPQTLDELLAAAQKLTKPGKAWGLGLYLGAGRALIEQTYVPLVWNFGSNIYNEAGGAAMFADEANQRAATWLVDAISKYQVVAPADNGVRATPKGAIATSFIQGQVAQSSGFGSYWLADLQGGGAVAGCVPASKDCKDDLASFASMPTTGKAQFVGGRLLGLHRLSKEPEAAFALLEMITSKDNLRSYPDAGLPARMSAWKSPELSSDFYQNWLAATRDGRPMPATPYYDELVNTLSAALERVLNQKAEIVATLKKAEADWNSRYARA
jgi:multiple sugar transport system substrate-binding protein